MKVLILTMLIIGASANAERVFYADTGVWNIYADSIKGLTGTDLSLEPICIASYDQPSKTKILLTVAPNQKTVSLSFYNPAATAWEAPNSFEFSNGNEWDFDFEANDGQLEMWFRDGLGYDVLLDFSTSDWVALSYPLERDVVMWGRGQNMINALMACAHSELESFNTSAI